MSSIQKPYEISVWEDTVNGAEGSTKEKKLAIIGSDSMAAAGTPVRAYNPQYTRNVNGTSTLTFELLLKYYDTETGTLKDNPFIPYLVNERKIKLKLDGKWYDYLIKGIDENSDRMSITYTCKDLYINELSKNGFNLEFSTELENNQGTVKELATRILDGTDWTVGKVDIKRQYIEEPLYRARVNTMITAKTMLGGKDITIEGTNASTESSTPHYIFIFYSCVANHDDEELFQFIYDGAHADGKGYPTDDDNVILTDENCYLEGITWKELTDEATNSTYYAPVLKDHNLPFTDKPELVTEYRGRRLVRSQKSAYDNAIGRAVGVYTDTNTGHSVYGYSETEYSSSQTVRNYIINSSEFYDESGWSITQDGDELKVGYQYELIPDEKIADALPYLQTSLALSVTSTGHHYFYNGGIATNKQQIHNITKGQQFIVHLVLAPKNHLTVNKITPYVCQYELSDEDEKNPTKPRYKVPKIGGSYFEVTERKGIDRRYNAATQKFDGPDAKYDYWYLLTCTKSITYEEFLNQPIGFFFDVNFDDTDEKPLTIIVYEASFFPYIVDEESKETDWTKNCITPGTVPKAFTKKRYRFYEPDPKAISEDEIFFLYDDYADELPERFEPEYDPEYQQIHSINGKESNRFNLIQDVCEAFECWARFDIKHDDEGKIVSGWKMLETQDKEPVANKTYWLKFNSEDMKSWKPVQDEAGAPRTGQKKYNIFTSRIGSVEDYIQTDGKTFSHMLAIKLLPTSNKALLDKVGKRSTFHLSRIKNGVPQQSPALYYWAGADVFSGYENLVILGDANNDKNDVYPSDNINDYWPDSLFTGSDSWASGAIPTNESATSVLQPLVKDYFVRQADASLVVTEGNHDVFVQGDNVYAAVPANALINFDPQETYYEKHFFQDKTVSFLQYIGKENFAGFKYGVNLRDITRNVDSEQVVTKIIVKENSNQFAKDGYCSIARALENPIKENFGYDFRYYINQGLLREAEVQTMLYGNDGLYTKLAKINRNKNADIEKLAQYKVTLAELDADVQTYQLAVDAAYDEQLEAMADFRAKTGGAIDITKAQDIIDSWSPAIYECYVPYITALNTLTRNQELLDRAKPQRDDLLVKVQELEEELESMRKQVDYYTQDFFSRYTRYVQEGTWISEDYIDDSLYYYDAINVLATSAMPKVSYTFNVIDVSSLDGYQLYTFDIGDKTYVEDTEFFGYRPDGTGTPYHEEVIISEITMNLDSPENDQIKIQNYKTQFEDLFQRVTAATQALQFHEGEYSKVTNSFTPEGDISERALQNTMDMANWVLENAHDQSVEIGDEGIKISSLVSPELLVRQCNAGIILSTDGGETWGTAITGRGISASYISVGTLDADKIRIMNGTDIAFAWDANGLNAYYTNLTGGEDAAHTFSKEDGTIDLMRYVRFCKYGIYGYQNRGNEQFEFDSLQDLIDNTVFSLTWNGIRLNRWNEEGSKWDPALEADMDGNLTLSGNIYAEGGKIGGWTILKKALVYSAGKDINENNVGQTKAFIAPEGVLASSTDRWDSEQFPMLPPDGSTKILLKVGNKFYVSTEGVIYAVDGRFTGTVYATAGEIGGWLIYKDGDSYFLGTKDGDLRVNPKKAPNIFLDSGGFHMSFDLVYDPAQYKKDKEAGKVSEESVAKTITDNFVFKAGNNFYVTTDGTLYASNAVFAQIAAQGQFSGTGNGTFTGSLGGDTTDEGITGTIYAEAGKIGGWIIKSETKDGKKNYYLGSEDGSIWLSSLGHEGSCLKVGNNFKVTLDGTVTAAAGHIGDWKINDGNLASDGNTIVLSPEGYAYGSISGSGPNKSWALKIGSIFGVTTSGELYCKEINALASDFKNLSSEVADIGKLTVDSLTVTGDITFTHGTGGNYESSIKPGVVYPNNTTFWEVVGNGDSSILKLKTYNYIQLCDCLVISGVNSGNGILFGPFTASASDGQHETRVYIQKRTVNTYTEYGLYINDKKTAQSGQVTNNSTFIGFTKLLSHLQSLNGAVNGV